MAPNVGALCRGASWPTDPGPGSEGGSLVPPGAGPGPRTCSTRFRSGAYSANRGEQGRSWPGPTSLGPLARTRTPGPVLARPNAPLGRVASRVVARSGVCARPPPRPLRPAPPHHLVRDPPWGEEGGVRRALVAAGGLPRLGRRLYAAVMHGPGGGGRTVLSQSEDHSRPHTVFIFVRPMSTQVRGLDLDAGESGPRSDPQIATRTQNRASRQTADYTGHRINLSRFAQEEAREPRGAGCSLTGGHVGGHGDDSVLMHLAVRGAP